MRTLGTLPCDDLEMILPGGRMSSVGTPKGAKPGRMIAIMVGCVNEFGKQSIGRLNSKFCCNGVCSGFCNDGVKIKYVSSQVKLLITNSAFFIVQRATAQ
jgi:hypothetical protein